MKLTTKNGRMLIKLNDTRTLCPECVDTVAAEYGKA